MPMHNKGPPYKRILFAGIGALGIRTNPAMPPLSLYFNLLKDKKYNVCKMILLMYLTYDVSQGSLSLKSPNANPTCFIGHRETHRINKWVLKKKRRLKKN